MDELIKNSDTQELVMEEITKQAYLEKAPDDSDGPGTCVIVFAEEGKPDNDGDMIDPGAIRLSKNKGTFSSFQHGLTPLGTWTLSREGNLVKANVTFLETQHAQDMRKYLSQMGSDAQFSFRAMPRAIRRDSSLRRGFAFTDLETYEVSSVYLGGGNTKLEAIKSADIITEGNEGNSDPATTTASTENKEVPEMDNENETVETTETPESTETIETVETTTAPEVTKAEKPKPVEVIKQTTVTDEGRPAPRHFAVPRQSSWASPMHELTKALFDNADFRDFADGKARGFGKQLSGEGELLKATLTSAGTIAPGLVIPVANVLTAVLDACEFLSWGSETYRRRRLPRTTPAQVAAGGDIGDQGVALAAQDFMLRTTAALFPVANRSLMADSSIASAVTERLIKDIRVKLQEQVLGGDGTGDNLAGFAHATQGVGSLAITQSGGEDRNILSDPDQGLLGLIAEMQGQGGMANYILANGRDAAKIRNALSSQHSAYFDDKEAPWGQPAGAVVKIAPNISANTMIIASLGDGMFHTIPVMGNVRVEASRDSSFGSDDTDFRATIYAANVVEDATGFRVLTGTNNYKADGS